MSELIASKTLKAIDPKKGEIEIKFGIGKPYQVEEFWRCRACLSGIHDLDRGVASDESWQSLILALKLIKQLLTYFQEDGGKLYWPDGKKQITVDEVFSNFDI